jgi:hypothetical protein
MGRLKKQDKPEDLPEPTHVFLLSEKKQKMIVCYKIIFYSNESGLHLNGY